MQQFFFKRKAKLTDVQRVSVSYLCHHRYTCATPGWQSDWCERFIYCMGLRALFGFKKPVWFATELVFWIKTVLTFTPSGFGRRVREAAIDSEMLTDLHLGPWSCCGMINSFCSSIGLPVEEVASPLADRIRSCENWLKERRSDELLFLIGDVGLPSFLCLAVLFFD